MTLPIVKDAASEKQVAFIDSLLTERELDAIQVSSFRSMLPTRLIFFSVYLRKLQRFQELISPFFRKHFQVRLKASTRYLPASWTSHLKAHH
jgi:hypothetical protein